MKQSQAGFTLVEALVAIAILGVVMAAIVSMLPGLATTNARTTDEQRAVLAAKAYFESARAEFSSNFDKDPTTIELLGTGNGLSCTRAPAEVLEVVAGAPALKRVTLTCTINGRQYPFALDLARTL
ncbi:type II secretion system protein [Deinococcus petrolearius]|uniref:Type II secretion system protein n=1 Tax=Deinococcus petrolearius TaxID=1751295 RepID=A0ABW1DLH8_9DEIO